MLEALRARARDAIAVRRQDQPVGDHQRDDIVETQPAIGLRRCWRWRRCVLRRLARRFVRVGTRHSLTLHCRPCRKRYFNADHCRNHDPRRKRGHHDVADGADQEQDPEDDACGGHVSNLGSRRTAIDPVSGRLRGTAGCTSGRSAWPRPRCVRGWRVKRWFRKDRTTEYFCEFGHPATLQTSP